jgi:hypothetical protein
MPATLTANGVTFGDSTQLNSKYGIIPQSKSSVFYQASAPTGWAKSTAHNNKALRVVSGTGGGSGPPGGGTAFNTTFPTTTPKSFSVTLTVAGTVGPHTLTTPEIRSHNHPGSSTGSLSATADHTHAYRRSILSSAPNGGSANQATHGSGTTDPSGTHDHPLTINNSTVGGNAHNHSCTGSGPLSASVDTRVKYLDVIICTFN